MDDRKGSRFLGIRRGDIHSVPKLLLEDIREI